MNAGAVRLVTRREIMTRLRDKGFLLSTLLTLVILAVVAALPGLIGDDGPRRYRVGLAGPQAAAIGERLDELDAASADVEITLVPVADRDDAEARVRAGDVRVALVDEGTLIVDDEVPERLAPFVEQAARVQGVIEAAGPDAAAAVAAAANAPAVVSVVALDPPDEDQETRQALVTIEAFILFGQIIGFGFWVASGVVEEKTSRVVEVLLAKVRPSTLLAGKVLGIGVIGLGQLAAILAVGLASAVAFGSIDVPPGLAGSPALALGWFVLGYVFYAAAFAVSGALVSRPEELQNSLGPLQILLMGAFTLAVIASGSPEGTVATVASFLPPTAPAVMPMRVAASAAAPWEVALSVVLTALAAAAMVAVAGRVYAGSILRTRGGRLRLREAWRSAEAV